MCHSRGFRGSGALWVHAIRGLRSLDPILALGLRREESTDSLENPEGGLQRYARFTFVRFARSSR
jgi:hypothetical protein